MPRLAIIPAVAAGCAPLPSAHTGSRYARATRPSARAAVRAGVKVPPVDSHCTDRAEGSRSLLRYVREAFDAYLRWWRARARLPAGGVRALPCREAAAFLQEARFCPSCAHAYESARHRSRGSVRPAACAVMGGAEFLSRPLRLLTKQARSHWPGVGIVQRDRLLVGWIAGIDRAMPVCAVTLIQRFLAAR